MLLCDTTLIARVISRVDSCISINTRASSATFRRLFSRTALAAWSTLRQLTPCYAGFVCDLKRLLEAHFSTKLA